jgi:hypothetical protein
MHSVWMNPGRRHHVRSQKTEAQRAKGADGGAERIARPVVNQVKQLTQPLDSFLIAIGNRRV